MTDATRTSGAPTRGIFITGTDTGVGKTVFTAALAAKLRAEGRDVVALKPFASGAMTVDGRRVSADTLFLEEAALSGEPPEELTPALFDAPLAPAVAARLEGRRVDVAQVAEHCRRVAARHEVALIEGVGGLLAPLSEDAVVADFAAMLELPLVVVAPPGLGTLNHTALTVECAHARGLHVAGIVISGYPDAPGVAEATNPDELERLTGLKVLAKVPWVRGLDVEAAQHGEWAGALDSIATSDFIAHA
ncbi:MAG: dethiobiotin synthase [Planctomycetes bacterium]|nr:dethiobiotin synthase [Planctomycetota bacterium]